MALWNEPEEEFTGPKGETLLEEMCKPEEEGGTQPARGLLIRDEAYDKPQKADKTKNFTYHKWQHVPPAEDAK
jgi:hypothetical protein